MGWPLVLKWPYEVFIGGGRDMHARTHARTYTDMVVL
jgi:hypothetical protein